MCRRCGIWHEPFIHQRSVSIFHFSVLWRTQFAEGWAEKDNGKKKIAIAYLLTSYTCKALNYVKRMNPGIITAIFVPDLPQFTYRNSRNLFVKLKNFFGKRKVMNSIERYSDKIDAWMLFSRHMSEKLPKCKNEMVFDGIVSQEFLNISYACDTNIYEDACDPVCGRIA